MTYTVRKIMLVPVIFVFVIAQVAAVIVAVIAGDIITSVFDRLRRLTW